jgi:hypothetical protein
MKTRLPPLLFALVGFLAASQSVLAASKKADDRTAALVAALQAVSPDPLGGRLGLAASGVRPDTAPATAAPPAAASRGRTAQTAPLDRDHRAYVIWKSVQKS